MENLCIIAITLLGVFLFKLETFLILIKKKPLKPKTYSLIKYCKIPTIILMLVLGILYVKPVIVLYSATIGILIVIFSMLVNLSNKHSNKKLLGLLILLIATVFKKFSYGYMLSRAGVGIISTLIIFICLIINIILKRPKKFLTVIFLVSILISTIGFISVKPSYKINSNSDGIKAIKNIRKQKIGTKTFRLEFKARSVDKTNNRTVINSYGNTRVYVTGKQSINIVKGNKYLAFVSFSNKNNQPIFSTSVIQDNY